MKKFNINDSIYIQITDKGWEHLQKTVGSEYIQACILPHRHLINGVEVYRLQCHEAFTLMPTKFGFEPLFNPNILIDDIYLK